MSTTPNLPRLWHKYVDNTFFIQWAEHSQQFLHNINPIDHDIHFTIEAPYNNGSIAFLNTLVSPGPDNTILTSVYRKPMHTDQYLHWDSHHNLSAKYSVFNTLTHKARTVCTNMQLQHKEEEPIKSTLLRCKYPIKALNRLQIHSYHRHSITQAQNNNNHSTNHNSNNIYMAVPYTKRLTKASKVFEERWWSRFISNEATPSRSSW